MHHSALETGRKFFKTYCSDREVSVVEIGSQNVNGSLRDVITDKVINYTGVDFVEGKGVDIVLQDPYKYPIQDNTFDVLVTSSCFEHSEMFWLSFLEGLRILKEDGVFYCNVPSSWMVYHRYPVDCWRFYPDAAKALQTWARYNNINAMVLESYVCPPGLGEFVADYVFVLVKNEKYLNKYPNRMIDALTPYAHYFNAFRFPKNDQFPDGWEKPACQARQDILLSSDGKIQYR